MFHEKFPGRSSRRAAFQEEDSEDDSCSTGSTTFSADLNTFNNEMEEIDDSMGEFDSFVDALYEKRSSTREAGLQGIISTLTSRVAVDLVDSRMETLLQQLLLILRRGTSSSESVLACRALALLVLTSGVGTASEAALEAAAPHLKKIASASSCLSSLRIAALEALAMLVFVAAADSTSTEEAMRTMWEICSNRAGGGLENGAGAKKRAGGGASVPAVRAAALAGWSLLLTTLSSGDYAEHLHHMQALAQFLQDSDLDVRRTAGEAVALLHELGWAGGSSSDMDGSGDEKPSYGSGAEAAGEEMVEDMVEKMRSMASTVTTSGSNKKQSKKERLQERTSFRGILSSIEGGVCPETSIRLRHGDKLCISTWAQTMQLSAMKKVLAEGFQRHLQDNELLHQVFHFIPREERVTFRSNVEKRLFQSPNSVVSKMRAQTRSSDRSFVSTAHLGRFSVGGEED